MKEDPYISIKRIEMPNNGIKYVTEKGAKQIDFIEGQKINIRWPSGDESIKKIKIEKGIPYIYHEVKGLPLRTIELEGLRFHKDDLKFLSQ